MEHQTEPCSVQQWEPLSECEMVLEMVLPTEPCSEQQRDLLMSELMSVLRLDPLSELRLVPQLEPSALRLVPLLEPWVPSWAHSSANPLLCT